MPIFLFFCFPRFDNQWPSTNWSYSECWWCFIAHVIVNCGSIIRVIVNCGSTNLWGSDTSCCRINESRGKPYVTVTNPTKRKSRAFLSQALNACITLFLHGSSCITHVTWMHANTWSLPHWKLQFLNSKCEYLLAGEGSDESVQPATATLCIPAGSLPHATISFRITIPRSEQVSPYSSPYICY